MKREDKRKAIQMLCESSGGLSSRMIADALGVSDMTVESVRRELPNYAPATRKGKDGKNYPAKMKREPRGGGDGGKTGNIGHGLTLHATTTAPDVSSHTPEQRRHLEANGANIFRFWNPPHRPPLCR